MTSFPSSWNLIFKLTILCCLRWRTASSFSQILLHRPSSTVIQTNVAHHIRSNNIRPIISRKHILFQSTTAENASSEKASYRALTREFFSIGLPAFVQLTAEPFASLVDTAYLGRLGPEVLGGAGVAISAQYAVSKLYNDPLLRCAYSFI